MEETNKFLGMDKGNIPIIALLLTILAVVISLFSMQNAAINQQNSNITALRSEMKADNAALRSEMKADNAALRSELKGDIREVRDDVGELGSGLNGVKIDIAEIKVRAEEIERRMPPLESMDERLDNLEREQARIKELLDALLAESE